MTLRPTDRCQFKIVWPHKNGARWQHSAEPKINEDFNCTLDSFTSPPLPPLPSPPLPSLLFFPSPIYNGGQVCNPEIIFEITYASFSAFWIQYAPFDYTRLHASNLVLVHTIHMK
jgi:hypothetical protein